MVRKVPALGCGDDLLKLFSSYGDVDELQISYAPEFESLSDAKDKLEGRRKEVLARLNSGRSKAPKVHRPSYASGISWVADPLQADCIFQQMHSEQYRDYGELQHSSHDHFPYQSMSQTVRFVREKLNEIQSSAEHLQAGPATKKARVDNRRRI